jgi:hypothetical protein
MVLFLGMTDIAVCSDFTVESGYLNDTGIDGQRLQKTGILPFFEIGLIQSGNIGKTVKIVDN